MEASILRYNTLIDTNHLQKGALEIVRVIRPDWPESQLNFKIFTDGITNRLIGVYKDENINKDLILIRVYGENTDLFIDRKLEFRNMRTMYKAGLSAPIYCTFLNGICYGFTPGKVLDEKMIRDQMISALVAENMARMHTLKPFVGNSSNIANCGKNRFASKPHVCLFSGLKKFLALTETSSKICTKTQSKRVYDPQLLQQEVAFLEKELVTLKSPIVFCHNDLLLKNIIYDEEQNKITFIDFEYSDYNYQAFDIANHFCEFCGLDSFDPSLYPEKEFQLRWLRKYLSKWHVLNGIIMSPTELDSQVSRLRQVVNKFTLAAHLYWGSWALVQATNSSIDFDYLNFAIKRIEEYFKRKKELFANRQRRNLING